MAITKSIIFNSFRYSLPIISGYFPLGFICGILLTKAGLNFYEVVLMSTFVFAGSAQFIAASLLVAGQNPFAIIMTTFIINLRHFLMSLNLSSVIESKKIPFLVAFAHGITDETYAINIEKYSDKEWCDRHAIAVNIIANLVWITSNFSGAYLGEVVEISGDFAGFILIAMFVSLLVVNIKGYIYIITALFAGVISLLLLPLLNSNLYIILASIIACTIAYFLDSKGEEDD